MEHVHLITLSDRASRGEYQDQSTPLLTEWLKGQGVQSVTSALLPDEPDQLEQGLRRQVAAAAALAAAPAGSPALAPTILAAVAATSLASSSREA